MAVDKGFAHSLWFWDVIERFLHVVFLHFLKYIDVLRIRQLVQINSLSFMCPKSDNICRRVNALICWKQQSLKDVGQISKIKKVMKLDGCRHVNLSGNVIKYFKYHDFGNQYEIYYFHLHFNSEIRVTCEHLRCNARVAFTTLTQSFRSKKGNLFVGDSKWSVRTEL